MSTTLDLINAIDAGKSTDIESAFNEIFASKVSAAIDQRRIEIAGNLFATQQEQPTGEQ